MTARRSTPKSAQEKYVPRPLVIEALTRWYIAATDAKPWGSAANLPCRDDLLGGLKERTMAAVGTGIWGISVYGPQRFFV
jgi:hypothetical protein